MVEHVYKSKTIWEPSYQSMVKLMDDRDKLLDANRVFSLITGKASEEIVSEINKIDSRLALNVKGFIERNESEEWP